MDRLLHKQQNSARRARKVRTVVKGSTLRPRLSVHISNLHITAQIIDDTTGKTLAYASTVGREIKGTKTERAVIIGKDIAAKAQKSKINVVALDRGSRKYHGRIKALADAARAEGLEF